MATHKLFFSSCFEDPEHQRLRIRDRVAKLNLHGAKSVWLAEDFELLKPSSPTPSFEKALFCVEGVRQSDVYVAVVRARHGSDVDLSPTDKVHTSYFELELFEAALLQKPTYVYFLKDAEPDERITSLLRLLAPALPGLCWTPLSEDEIYRRVETILDVQIRQNKKLLVSHCTASGRRMSDQLTGFRFAPYDPRRETPDIQFMGGLRDGTMARPNADLVGRILERSKAEQSYQIKLVLLWAAIRELMGAPPDNSEVQSFLPLWEQALGGWNSSGAWYGLHGHPLMGCLGALSSLSFVQERLGTPARPHGAFSSEYYSIAKKLGSQKLKKAVLTMSRLHIDAALDDGETAGKLAMRGSIFAATHDYRNAVSDYERVVFLRDGIELATDAEKGDAKTELGFALVLAGQRRRGIRVMEDGLALLERSEPSGFLIRAKRKLGRAYIAAGSPRLALTMLASAHDTAAALGAHDQIGQIDKIAKKLQQFAAG